MMKTTLRKIVNSFNFCKKKDFPSDENEINEYFEDMESNIRGKIVPVKYVLSFSGTLDFYYGNDNKSSDLEYIFVTRQSPKIFVNFDKQERFYGELEFHVKPGIDIEVIFKEDGKNVLKKTVHNWNELYTDTKFNFGLRNIESGITDRFWGLSFRISTCFLNFYTKEMLPYHMDRLRVFLKCLKLEYQTRLYNGMKFFLGMCFNCEGSLIYPLPKELVFMILSYINVNSINKSFAI